MILVLLPYKEINVSTPHLFIPHNKHVSMTADVGMLQLLQLNSLRGRGNISIYDKD